jgi:DNA-binding NarL/FixJ family response regulator
MSAPRQTVQFSIGPSTDEATGLMETPTIVSQSIHVTNSTLVARSTVPEAPNAGLRELVEKIVEQTVTRVLIADEHPLIVAGMRRMIEGLDDLEIVGEARSGSELLRLVERRAPGVVLMELRMPGVLGVECIEEVRTRWPAVKVVVLSAREDRESIDLALAAGASAYILKSAETRDILSVLRQAVSGVIFHASSPVLSRDAPADSSGLLMLTGRERSVLAGAASGLTSAAIGRDLWLSSHTVKFHLTNIYRKLGVTNRASAVRFALEDDLIAKEAAQADGSIAA